MSMGCHLHTAKDLRSCMRTKRRFFTAFRMTGLFRRSTAILRISDAGSGVACNSSEPALLFTAHCLLRAQKRPFSAKAKNGLFKSSFFYSYAAIQRPETLLLPG